MKELTYLKSLGKLSSDFDSAYLVELSKHNNQDVRCLAIKNLGKLKDLSYLNLFIDVYKNDKSTIVKREAVSSVGRLKNELTKPFLISILEDKDPKIVCQVIRGLLSFNDKDVLKPLINHENEMVRTLIYKEFYSKKETIDNQNDSLKNTIIHGDTIEIMKQIKDETIHLTFTSPPYYNARDYSIYSSYKAYLEFLTDVFKEVYRITKEGRFLIVNTSPIIIPRISRSHSSKRYPIPFDLHHYLVEMGWEFIDDIVWLKPEASVKNRNGGFKQHRKPLAYKPNCVTEYLMVYRKTTDKLIDWNIKQYDNDIVESSKIEDGYETTNVWKIKPSFDKVHSAVFPIDLCKKVIKYYSFKGDLVFDCFGGSGTVGKVAKELERSFLLTELNDVYFEYMKNNKTFEGGNFSTIKK